MDKKENTKLSQKQTIKICIITVVLIILIPTLICRIVILKQNIDEKNRIRAEEARLAAQVEVPNIIGMKVDEAKKALNDIGLEINIHEYDKKLTDEKPDEYVVEKQYPSAKEKVDPNTEVKVFFKELMVIKADTLTGMKFKFTKEEYAEKFLEKYESESKLGLVDPKFYFLTKNANGEAANAYSISLYQTKSSPYGLGREAYYSVLAVEDEKTNELIRISGSILSYDSISQDLRERALGQDTINLFASIRNITTSKASSIISYLLEKLDKKERAEKYEDGILYMVDAYDNLRTFDNYIFYYSSYKRKGY